MHQLTKTDLSDDKNVRLSAHYQ